MTKKRESLGKVLKESTCLSVAVYLQKASLKAAGLLSREKAVVIPRENHLRCNRCMGKEKKGKKVQEKSIKREERRWHETGWIERKKINR